MKWNKIDSVNRPVRGIVEKDKGVKIRDRTRVKLSSRHTVIFGLIASQVVLIGCSGGASDEESAAESLALADCAMAQGIINAGPKNDDKVHEAMREWTSAGNSDLKSILRQLAETPATHSLFIDSYYDIATSMRSLSQWWSDNCRQQ